MNDFDDVASHTYLSHGHACLVLFLADVSACDAVVQDLGAEVSAYEVWPYCDSTLGDVFTREPQDDRTWGHPEPIVSTGVGFEAAAQVAQFNANLSMLSRFAALYAPETRVLVDSLHASASSYVERLRAAATSGDEDHIRQTLHLEGVLVETNAVLTLYCSQLSSGALPLREDVFPVGEYSLLGIGAMTRAAWRIYSHLNGTFAEYDNVGVVARMYSKAAAFDPYAPSGRIDYRAWRRLRSNIPDLTDGRPGEYLHHVPYFSSRWGFHESKHSISMSWQCLYASASREWNLLTLTHEYLHSHVRGMLAHVLLPQDGDLAVKMSEMYDARERGANALESLQIAFVEALLGLQSTTTLAGLVSGGDQEVSVDMPEKIDPDVLRSLHRRHADLVHEIIVHVLDFRYVYDGRDDSYVDSIWSSWAQVPSVPGKIEHYVLRTLCALAATSTEERTPAMFEDVAGRLRRELAAIENRPRIRPVVRRALDLLDDDVARRRLGVEFIGARYIVELALNFFLDDRLTAALVRDDLTSPGDGRRTYGLEVGDYRGEAIASPIGFLLDAFEDYPAEIDAGTVEQRSVWQMLQLV